MPKRLIHINCDESDLDRIKAELGHGAYSEIWKIGVSVFFDRRNKSIIDLKLRRNELTPEKLKIDTELCMIEKEIKRIESLEENNANVGTNVTVDEYDRLAAKIIRNGERHYIQYLSGLDGSPSRNVVKAFFGKFGANNLPTIADIKQFLGCE